jgi:hypothetical protein
MKLCGNCGVQLSCGCQRRDASDGKSCCDQCISAYELSIAPPPPPAPIPLPVVEVIQEPIIEAPIVEEQPVVEEAEVIIPAKVLTRRSSSNEKQ